MKRLILICLLCICARTLFADLANEIDGSAVYPKTLQDLPLGPHAVVMKDAQGQDALVVFYRLKGKGQRVGFAIARDVDPKTAALIWDKNPYELSTSVIRSGGFSPVPVIMNKTLYLFGRDRTRGDGRHLIYQTFENIEALIAQTKYRGKKQIFRDTGIRLHHRYHDLAAVAVNQGMLLSYYPRKHHHDKPLPLESQFCTPDANQKLNCKAVTPDTKTSQHYPMKLITFTQNKKTETLMLLGDNQKGTLTVQRFDPVGNLWYPLYTTAHIQLPTTPMAAQVADGHLCIYYKSTKTKPDTHKAQILKATAPLTSVLTDPLSWSYPFSFSATPSDIYQTDAGIDAITFKKHRYVFYTRVYDTHMFCSPNQSRSKALQCYPVRDYPNTVFYQTDKY